MRIVFHGERPRTCVHNLSLDIPCETCEDILARKALVHVIEVEA